MVSLKRQAYGSRGFLILTALLLSACLSQSHAVKPAAKGGPAEGRTVYVVSHGWHTGLVVPARQIQERLHTLKARFGPTPHIEFGWGDRAFYPAAEVSAGLALKALLWPTASVIHAVAVPANVGGYFPDSEVIALCLSTSGYASLLRHISDSFLKDGTGRLLPLQSGIYGNSQFYAATGLFSLMNTCNTWTARGLHRAGVEIPPTLKTARSVMDYAAAHRASEGRPAAVCHQERAAAE